MRARGKCYPSPALRERVPEGRVRAERSEVGPALLRKCRQDSLQDCARGVSDLIVPDPEHPPSRVFEKLRPPIIRIAIEVLAAIDLYDQPVLRAGEISHVRSDRMLPPEPVAQ